MAFDLGKWLRDITGQNKPVIKSTPTTVVKQPTTNWQLERAKEQRANPVAFEQKYPTVKTTPTIDYNNPLTFVKEWGKEWLDTAGRMAKSTVEPIVYKVKESELNKKQDVDKQAFTAGKISPQEYFSRMNQNSQTRNKLVNTLEGGLKDYKDMTSFLRSGAQGIVQSIPKTVGSVTELAGNVGTWLAPKDSGVENFFKGISKTGQDMTTSVDKIATDTFQTKDDNQAIKNLGQSGGELLTDVATGKIVLKSLGFLKYADDATRLQKIAKASSAVQNLISGKYATRVFNETWNNAKQAGKSDTQAGITATGNAAVQAIIERFGGVGKYLDKVGLRGKLTKVVINGIKEFGEEWTQQFTDNIANLTINPPTSILDFTTRLFAGTGSAGMSGLVLGTAVSGGTIDSDTDAYRPTAAEVPGGTPESKLISKLPLTKTLDKVPYVGNVANYEILKSKAYSMPDSDISILERSENGSNYNNLTQQEAARADKVIKDIGGRDNIAKVLGFTIERRSNGTNKYVDLSAPSIIDNINKRGIGMSIQDVNNNHTQLAQTLDSTPPGQKAEVVQQMIENQKAKTAAIESAPIVEKDLTATKTPLSAIDSSQRGNLNQLKELKTKQYTELKRLKAIRDKGNIVVKGEMRMPILKADMAYRETLRSIKDTESIIGRRAEELGKTTKLYTTPTPQVSKTEAPAISKPFTPLSQPIDNIPAITPPITSKYQYTTVKKIDRPSIGRLDETVKGWDGKLYTIKNVSKMTEPQKIEAIFNEMIKSEPIIGKKQDLARARYEYTKSQPISVPAITPEVGKIKTLYHATPTSNVESINKSGLSPSKKGVMGSGIYFTKNPDTAKSYVTSMKKTDSSIVEATLSPDARIYEFDTHKPYMDLDEIGKQIKDMTHKENMKELLIKNGYDGVTMNGNSTAIYNKDVITQKSTPQPKPVPAITPTKPKVVEELISINDTEKAIRETASQYKTAKEYQDELTDMVWSNNKKGQGVDFVMNDNKYEPGFDIKRISNNSPFYREFFAENGRKPTKGEISTLIDGYLNGENNIMKYELAPEEVDIFNTIKDNESAPLESIQEFKPLSQPIDNIPAIAKQVTASQKAVASNIAPNTKAAPVVKPPKSQSKLNKKSQSSTTIIPENQTKLNNTNADLESVKSGLQTKADSLERLVYGDTTADIVGGDKTAGKYVETVRKGKEAYNKAIEKGMSSENNIARRITRGIRTLFGSAGDTATRITKKGEFRGGIDESVNLANDFNEMGKTMLPDTASQERVWAVLDPELAGKTISESSLTSQEKTALQAIRQASDLINDTNFSMGKISHETWLAGKDGKYLTRAYEEFDVPTELKDSQAFKAGKGKLETGGYMQRKDVDTWKQENAIKDPFYLASKRIQSTMRNKSITDYANWVNKNADMVSDTPKKGYTQLSDSSMWGELSGKNVRHDVLTDMKGFYSDSKALQGIYDGLNAYDRFKPRQILKMTKTVLNPATRLGNQTSNRVFAALNGINIAKFEWNMHKFAPQELANNGKYARMLRKEGILGTDMTKYELSKTLIKDGVDQGEISKLLDKTKSSYGAADDKAKLSAFKYWLDKGKTTDEAITKVRNGFQDYSKVGLLYDVGAKVPFVGKPFIRFQSELARIIKNSATENPLSLATVVGSIALMGTLASKASGESEEDKKTREGRFGTPVIPFTQIPLVFQTPIGEINVGRMFGMYETAGADTVNKNLIQRASKYLPFDIPTSKDELVKMFGNDVLLGGIANQITDTDFRGKSITDQDSNKYQPSTLTDTEKNINRASAAYHNYQIPFINDIENVGRSILGLKDQYGKTKTPGQAISKLTGFKVEQFGPKQAEEQRAKDAVYAEYDRTDAKKQINSVIKDQAEGKIDAATAQKRIDGLNKKSGVNTSTLESDGKVFANPNGGFSYLDDNGSLQTEKTKELADLEISKSAFKKSDKNIQIVGDNVLRKNKNGEVQVTSKDEYDYDIGTAKLSSLKSADDVDGWIEQANKQLELLGKQYTDPNADELDKIDIQNKVDTLIENITKYKSYGGFTKPKSTEAKDKASIAKILAIASSARSTSSDTYASLNKLLQGTRSYTKPSVQKVALKTITVKK